MYQLWICWSPIQTGAGGHTWESMLGHQLPALLPPVQHYWDQLEEFFLWLFGELIPERPAPYPGEEGEELISKLGQVYR